MTVFITGGCKNGKSTFAVRKAMELGAKRFYVATMIPRDDEDAKRVEYHRAKRAGLGFETIESSDLSGFAVEKDGVYLVDSVTALVQNAMFPGNGKTNLRAAKAVVEKVKTLMEGAGSAAFVSDFLYSNGRRPEGLTAEFARNLSEVERFLAQKCDKTYEICASTAKEWEKVTEMGRDGMEFVIGGAYQGKLEYVMGKYRFSEKEVCFCNEQEEIDWSKPCVYGLERYLLGCVDRGEKPVLAGAERSVVVMEDVFCGLVPMEERLRQWREVCGHTAAKLAAEAAEVTRLFCGLSQRLK